MSWARMVAVRRHRHPVNQALVDQAPLGARIAEAAARFIGSWKFIVIQTVLVSIWVLINVGFVTGLVAFDPYPFILLNLAFSTQAAYAAPLILLASNRSAEHDRLVLEHLASEADDEELKVAEQRQAHADIIERLAEIEALLRRDLADGEVLSRPS